MRQDKLPSQEKFSVAYDYLSTLNHRCGGSAPFSCASRLNFVFEQNKITY